MVDSVQQAGVFAVTNDGHWEIHACPKSSAGLAAVALGFYEYIVNVSYPEVKMLMTAVRNMIRDPPRRVWGVTLGMDMVWSNHRRRSTRVS